jgi:thioredoxin reductase
LDNDLLVVGGGDSAIEAAMALSKGGRNRVTLAYRGDDFSRLRARNLEMFRDAEAQKRVTVLRRATVSEIHPDRVTLKVDGSPHQLANQYVFILAGGESPEVFLRKTGVEIVEKALTL